MESTAFKFSVIRDTFAEESNVLTVTELCDIAGVSRSSYYTWLHAEQHRQQREAQDREAFDKILKAYKFRGYAKGVRGIHMRLLRKGIRMNVKKIRRLMRKYNLFCPIRKANPYRRMQKAIRTNNTAENLVKREFEDHGPRSILLTDITYIPLNGSHCYLSTILDACTK
ncbi:MAG: IS3 family transposase [Oscillospiraceae bacterium]|nr:IS3 family transposase [Oscillospiraceae bacterium]